MVDLGTLNWSISGTATADETPCRLANVSGMETSVTVSGMIAEKYHAASTIYIANMTNDTMIRSGGKIYIASEETPSGNLCYPLAQPITTTLTPQTINSLLGQNNVWSDAGDVSVTWKEKLYTEGY